MNHTHQSRQDAKHSALSTGRNQPRRWWLGIEAAVARPFLRVKNRGLPVEAEDRAVDVRLAEEHAGVVDEVARGKVVRAVEDDVVVAQDVECVLGGQRAVVRHDVDVGIEVEQPRACRIQLRRADIGGAVKHLPLQVRDVDVVEVDEPDASHARGGEIQRRGRAQPPRADDQHRAARELLLPFFAELRQREVAGVAVHGSKRATIS